MWVGCQFCVVWHCARDGKSSVARPWEFAQTCLAGALAAGLAFGRLCALRVGAALQPLTGARAPLRRPALQALWPLAWRLVVSALLRAGAAPRWECPSQRLGRRTSAHCHSRRNSPEPAYVQRRSSLNTQYVAGGVAKHVRKHCASAAVHGVAWAIRSVLCFVLSLCFLHLD